MTGVGEALVGRSRELATAAFARDAARAGRGSLLTVTGATGIGKTWLCEAIARAATEEGFTTGWGSCWPGAEAPPLWAWHQAVADLAGAGAAKLLTDPPAVDDPAWFARCVEIVDLLRDVTASRPGLVVIDDAHAADVHTTRLAQFVGRHVRGLHLVLVVAHQPSPDLDQLDRDGTAIELRGLGTRDVAAVLGTRGLDDLSDTDLAFIVDATGGRPLDMLRLASNADGSGVVRSVVEAKVASLTPELAYAAACAAVLDSSPRLRDLAAVADLTSDEAVAVRRELESLGLAVRQPADGLTFTHEQVRSTLVATLAPEAVLNVHARATMLLDGGPPSVDRLCRRAEHALAATARSVVDARMAVKIAQEAAAALIADNQPERAASLLADARAAHEVAGLGRPPATLLAAHANAALRCGRLGIARELFPLAATAAEEDDDPVSLALAAIGMGGVWLAEQRSRIDRDRVLGIQRMARDALPESEVTLRLRLDIRLAAEFAYETGDLASIRQLVAAARELGDPTTMAEALSLYHHTILGPEHAAERIPVARELIHVAANASDTPASLMGLLWLTSDMFMAGDPQAERALRELHERADRLGGRHAAYIAQVMDVMLLQRAGRFDEAEQAAQAAFAVGMEVGDADALAYLGAQMVLLRWIQGRSEEVLELAAETAASPTLTPGNHAFTGVFAALAAGCGQLDRARAALARLRGELKTIPQSSAWLATLFTTIEAAYVLGDVDISLEAADLLEPYADFPVLGSLAVVCLGSGRRSLGLAAVTAGDLDRGVLELEAAVIDNERLGNRPLAAMTAADLANALAARGRRGDRDAALARLDQAIREADAIGLSIRAAEWRRRRQAIVEEESRQAAPFDDAVGTLGRRGSSWVLSVAGRQVVTPDRLGMQYLAWLLTHPGQEIAAATLAAEGGAGESLAARPEQPVLDDRAMAAYRRRVTELEDELAEAEQYADSERAARARMELDAVIDELARATNRFGKARPFASSAERARTAVQKAVRRALDHIESVDATLGAALRRSVQTGRTCSYQPGPGAPSRWVTTPNPRQ